MPSNVRFAVVRKLFGDAGWSLRHVRGSHHIFAKPGRRPYPVPVHKGQVKHAYVREIKKLLARDDA
ncbi:MAG: type II toxin-antitoxin system HicA family toxin [Planctomycetota bacterium]